MSGRTLEPDGDGARRGGLRDMLLVTAGAREAAAARATAPVAPSPLLARIQDFLPQLAAANDALPAGAGGDSCVEIVRETAPEDALVRSGELRAAAPKGGPPDGDGAGAGAARGVAHSDEDSQSGDDAEESGPGKDERGYSVGGVRFSVADTKSEDSSSSEDDDDGKAASGDTAERPSVHMDLYVDSTLGDLIAKEEDAAPPAPLIVDLGPASEKVD